MAKTSQILDTLLKQPDEALVQLKGPQTASTLWRLVGATTACLLVCGLVLGTFSMGTQLAFAPLKVLVGMVGSAVICLPSFYILGALSGLRANLAQTAAILVSTLACTSLVLAGFAPVLWVFGQATDSVFFMGALTLLAWFISTMVGLRVVRGAATLDEVPSRGHLHLWTSIYLLVSLQMSASLRPLIGQSDTVFPQDKQFFLGHWVDVLLD